MDIYLQTKYNALKDIIAGMDGVLVAFSGGVDSTLLARAAFDMLHDRALAVTAISPLRTEAEGAEAVQLARLIGIRHLTINSIEMTDETFLENPPDRCYICKKHIFATLKDMAAAEGLAVVIEGSNLDDLQDYRPGKKASAEAGIRSPLQEAGLGKSDIRKISRELGLPTWDKPSAACLASRFPHGTRLTEEKLARVARAEEFLHGLGFRQVRVRDYEELARIEVEREELPAAVSSADKIVSALAALGYRHITLDLAGFTSGSMNPAGLN